MPELPEVETVRRGLNAALKGVRIEKVLLRRDNLRVPFPKDFARVLTGRTVPSIAAPNTCSFISIPMMC
jgi:formamidopyrimidine-DNA glycosylase